MATKILIKRSTTTGEVPTTSDLATGELGINTVDKRIFTNNSGTIVELGTAPTVQAVAGNASVGGTFDVVGQVTVDDFTATGTVNLTAATTTVAAPTADAHAATKKYVDDEVNAILDGAPAALDTLNEIAAAINDDANLYTTLTNSIATKLSLAGGTMTGSIDMGANKVTSTATPTADSDLTRKAYVDGLYQSTVDAETSAANALASEQAAATSASNAATSASTAATQASNASSSATAAASSATQASNSATSSANSATAAASSATAASNSATTASGHADNAEASATAAASSATAAAQSATETASLLDTKVSKSGDTMTGNLTFGDNDKAVFGAGSDLQIYHDGSDSYIADTGTGDLNIRAHDHLRLQNADGSKSYFVAFDTGASRLYYDGSEKLATTSTGVDVTGTVTADGLTVDGTASTVATFNGVASGALINIKSVDAPNGMSLGYNVNEDFVIYNAQNTPIRAYTNAVERLRIANNGDISFYEDTGTTPKFFWDASAERLGIGTSSPASKLHVADGNITVGSSTNTSSTNTLLAGYGYNIGATTYGNTSIRSTYNNGDNSASLEFYTASNGLNTAERMRIDSSGNVGIGTSSPSTFTSVGASNLVVGDGTTNKGATIYSSSTGYGGVAFADGTGASAQYAGLIQYGHSADSMNFFTGATEKMRIDSSGNLLVGTTTSSLSNEGSMWFVGGTGSYSGVLSIAHTTTNANGSGFINFGRGTSYIGSISQSGTSAVSYNTSSDYRLKKDWQAMTGASERVEALKPVNFAWKADGSRVDGFLAHELAEVVPEAVTGEKDAMRTEEYEVTPAVLDDEGNVVTEAVMGEREVPEYQGIDQSKLVPLLTASLQEALVEIKSLKTRIETLENK